MNGAGAGAASASATPASPPGAPTGLAAVAGDGQVAGDGRVALSWTAGSDNGAAITGWQVRWSTDGGATWDQDWTDLTGSDATTASHGVTGLVNGIAYSLEVRAENDVGAGAGSGIGATPAAVPGAPTGLAAMAGDGAVTLSWTTGADHGAAISGWQVRRSTDGGATWNPDWTAIAGSAATTASHGVTGLTNGTEYTFEVRAENDVGAGAAARATATPKLAPAAPTGLAAVAGDGRVTLSWTAGADNGAAVTGWQVRWSTDGGATWNPDWTAIAGSAATTASHTVTGLAAGTAHAFQVRAVNGAVGGAASASASATTSSAAPAAPTGLAASAHDGAVALSWTAGADNGAPISKWQARRGTDGGASWDQAWTDLAGSAATTTAHTVTGLADDTAYTFQVRAVNSAGTGAASALITVATPREGGEEPEEPATPAPAGPVSGILPGTLSVDRDGAAVYEIPIAVPPGTAGVEPGLSLAYASNGGNGLVGLGWSLGGLSAIARCPKTEAQDGERGAIAYDADDRFCLDGQRLIAVSGDYGADGSEYRTEIDSFSKVISHGSAGTGPQYFEVRTKSGQVMHYGNTDDSRIEAVGKTEARLWALNRLADTVGNYLTVSYREEDGLGYPERIDYTGNGSDAAYASVRLSYEARHDTASGPGRRHGHAGRASEQRQDLSRREVGLGLPAHLLNRRAAPALAGGEHRALRRRRRLPSGHQLHLRTIMAKALWPPPSAATRAPEASPATRPMWATSTATGSPIWSGRTQEAGA